jgi:hypothetical protein
VSSPSPIKWTSPPPGFVMLNSDAAIFKDLGGMGVGVVGRDHLGAVLLDAPGAGVCGGHGPPSSSFSSSREGVRTGYFCLRLPLVGATPSL